MREGLWFSNRRRTHALLRGAAIMLEVGDEVFAAVIDLPPEVHIHDFSTTEGVVEQFSEQYSIGKYDEERRGMYETELFADNRFIHMGIDIGAPVYTSVKSFAEGKIYSFGINSADGDYGPTIIVQHLINGVDVWALYGHLSTESLANLIVGQGVESGQRIAWVGDEEENGGWPPHLHFQLSLVKPEGYDIPGVVSPEERLRARQIYPDPRIVLGPLY
jgi:murein DD-endopeptidase MepM/ murein hydrolase activator NlpD